MAQLMMMIKMMADVDASDKDDDHEASDEMKNNVHEGETEVED